MRPYALSVLLPLLAASALSGAPAAAAPAVAGASSGKTVLRKIARGNDISTLLVSRTGTQVALDPMDLVDGLQADLGLITHKLHADPQHVVGRTQVPLIVHQLRSTSVGEVRVTAIAASHKGGAVDAAAPDHVIYRIDVDGLVVALLGCLGQKAFTPEQLQALDRVDVAVVTADRGGFEMQDMVETSLALMKQLRPRVVVPLTHHRDDEDALERLAELGEVETVPALAVSKEDLADGPMRVVNVVMP